MFHDFLVSTVHEGGVVEITFSLLALLGQDVAMKSQKRKRNLDHTALVDRVDEKVVKQMLLM